jgi:hypothetical protein
MRTPSFNMLRMRSKQRFRCSRLHSGLVFPLHPSYHRQSVKCEYRPSWVQPSNTAHVCCMVFHGRMQGIQTAMQRTVFAVAYHMSTHEPLLLDSAYQAMGFPNGLVVAVATHSGDISLSQAHCNHKPLLITAGAASRSLLDGMFLAGWAVTPPLVSRTGVPGVGLRSGGRNVAERLLELQDSPFEFSGLVWLHAQGFSQVRSMPEVCAGVAHT